MASNGEMQGRIVGTSDSHLYLYCAGEGTPAVILEAGLGDTHETWASVQAAVAAFTRVCSYDRAGLGRSTPGVQLRTAGHMTEELHALLHNVGIPSPYVLVGHSFGGLIVQLFASSYADETAGLVLVDSAHEEQEAWLAAELSDEEMAEQMGFQNGGNAEGADATTSFAEVRAAHWRLQAPLVVLVRGMIPPDEEPPNWTPERAERMGASWLQLQAELAQRSPQGRLVIAERSGHNIHHSQPEIVVDAIRQIVDAGR
jgi:pimeloyl-ACP methyl ester carboxylesterase